jgi:hypothetical protein
LEAPLTLAGLQPMRSFPARVDQHSVDALRLTFEMLSDQTKDYHRFNQMAKLDHTPRIHAVVMTHCGYSRKSKYTPDNTTAFFTQRAIDIAKEYEHLFSDKIENCFYLFDDFFLVAALAALSAFQLLA